MWYTHSTPVVVALHHSHGRSYTRLTQTECASACLYTDTWDHTWRNQPCAKLPRPPRQNSPEIPNSTFLRPTSQQYYSNPLPTPPSTPFALPKPPSPPRLYIGSRSSSRGRMAILSLPQYALVDCYPLAALLPMVTFLWRRTAVSFSHGTHILD